MAAYKTCEIGKRFNDLSSSSSGSDDSDFDEVLSSTTSQYSISGKTSKHQATKAPTTVQRMPTRRPDPNVSNRNALLARENRRKKKEYLETIEKELDSMKYANKKLHKTLRKHIKLVKKLEHEKQYYKGLVSNQSGILDLVSVLHGKVPPPPMAGGSFSPKQSSCSPTDSNRSSSSSYDDQLPSYDFNDDNDSDYAPYGGGSGETNWDQLLGMSDDHPLPDEASTYFPTSSITSARTNDTISDEHNYYQSAESGVCLHLAEGTVSLEECLNCDKRSYQPPTLPEQLLVVD